MAVIRAFGGACAGGCSAFMLAATASAQTYLAKPIRYVISFPPGGSNDILARTIGARQGEAMGTTIFTP